jgi:hypothetical protein
MLFDDELTAQGNHEEDAEPAADQSQQENARVFQIEAKENQRGQGEDDPGGDGLARIARGLDNVVFQNRGAAKGTQNADRQNGNRDGGGNGEASAEAYIHSDGTEDDAKDGAEQHGAKGKFRAVVAGGNKGLKLWHE